MDKLNLAALGERLKLGGERLKTGGAEMSRKVSGKMKEILQGPSQEAKMVEEATADSLNEPNWGLNLKICGLLNNDQFNGSEVVRAIKKRIAGRNPLTQRLSLDLLEACAMNCDKVFSEVASEKLLEEIVRMIDNPQTDYANRQKALQLIEAWGQSDDLDYLPVFKQTYMNLKARQVNEKLAVEQAEHTVTPPESYPYFDMDRQDLDPEPDTITYDDVSILEEEKKEALLVAQNSMDILSSMLNVDTKSNPVKDELTLSIIEKCREAQPMIRRIVETTTGDEPMLIEAISINDRLQEMLCKFNELEIAAEGQPKQRDSHDSSSLENEKGVEDGGGSSEIPREQIGEEQSSAEKAKQETVVDNNDSKKEETKEK